MTTGTRSPEAAACCAPLGTAGLSDDQAQATARLFKALADPHRVKVVNLLATSPEPVCVCELTGPLGLSQPTVSHHLKKLVQAGCGSGCCGGAATAGEPGFGAERYAAGDRDELPDAALLASLGCGNPTAVAELHAGETVLDLGSGGGIDVLLSARRVGPTGKAYGLDMTEEMLHLARANATQAGAGNVELLKGQIEAIPLPAETVDVVISNCVVNLSTDKPAVFAETFRVLKPGGRVGITDVVAEDRLSSEDRAERGAWVGCIAGALSRGEYQAGLAAAGFTGVSVDFTHQVGDGLHSAIIKATKPPAGDPATTPVGRTTLPMASGPACC